MKASECIGLRSSKFSEYEDKYKTVQEMRDVFSKQVALDERIQRVEVMFKSMRKCMLTLINLCLQYFPTSVQSFRKANNGKEFNPA